MKNCIVYSDLDLRDCCDSTPEPETTVKGDYIYRDAKKHAKILFYLGGIDAKPHLEDCYQIQLISDNKYLNGQIRMIQIFK